MLRSSRSRLSSAAPLLPAGLTVFFLLLPAGCSPGAADSTHRSGVESKNRRFNDAGRFLAGLHSVPGSAYTDLEKTAAWQAFANEMNEAWKTVETRRLQPVSDFQKRELGGSTAISRFVFYPFSGPDVLYMQRFYPDGTVYLLAGLEMPGSILEPAEYESKNLEIQLEGLRTGISSLFQRSFFVTGEMSRQLRGQKVEGVLPVVLSLLARSGNTIENVRNVEIDASGKLVELAAAKPKQQPKPGENPDGLEVTFHKDGESVRRTLYYFRLDLGPGLDQNPSFLTFAARHGKSATLIKSASFLLHTKPFSTLRDFIVANSTQIVQDDTGIRFEIFEKLGWRVRLFGAYSEPDHPFKAHYQPALRAAFATPGRAGTLGFSMGYGTGRRPSHVIVAERP